MAGISADTPTVEPTGRERIERAAYDLFTRRGTRAVGVDAIVTAAGVAKMTLYRHFPSKDDLVVAYLQRREELWTFGWLQAEVERRSADPVVKLLSIFDVFGGWFKTPDFEGCPFLTTMLEVSDSGHPSHLACVRHLSNIRGFISELATAAGVSEPDAFARQWHILMKGSIMAATEGDTMAAARAREMGELLLASHHIDVADRSVVRSGG